MQLTELDHLPEGLLERPASGLHRSLDGPTLIHLEGRAPRPLFISVLQHGNEVTGWEAVRRLLKTRGQQTLSRNVSILIGNVAAARSGARHLNDQPDFNRCWPGGELTSTPVGHVFRQVTERMRALDPVASIDIHNNTGLNPHYAAINRLAPEYHRLAAAFSDIVVYFTIPSGVQSAAFAEFCPSVTLECGLAGEVHGTDHSLSYLEKCLDHLPLEPGVGVDQMEGRTPPPVYRMMATVRVRDEVDFSFSGSTNLQLRPDLDQLNFRSSPKGTVLGRLDREAATMPLTVMSKEGRDITDEVFVIEEGWLKTRKPVTPAMLTMDRAAIRQDCLCYLMQAVPTDELTGAFNTAAELPESADTL